MGYQSERDQFVYRMGQENLPHWVAVKLLSAATTLQRLAVAQCNGDWPADNGTRETKPCVKCEQYWVASVIRKDGLCKDCATVQRIEKLMPQGWAIQTQGDPRGYVLRVIPPSYAERNAGREVFNLDAIGVPTRG